MSDVVAFQEYINLMEVKRSITTDNALGDPITWFKSHNLIGKILTILIVVAVLVAVAFIIRLVLKFTVGI